jgi:transcriptional regulator GlxA family with amidase domain
MRTFAFIGSLVARLVIVVAPSSKALWGGATALSRGESDNDMTDFAMDDPSTSTKVKVMRKRIAILIADGFTDSGLSIALDVFRTANALAARAGEDSPFRVSVASAEGGPVRAASGLVIEKTARAVGLKADIVIVPGLWVTGPADVDRALQRTDVKRLVRVIRASHARGALVGSSCGGAFLLADAGVLDGREATTTWWLASHLAQRRPGVKVVAEASLIVQHRVVTAGAVFAQADLSLYVVGRVGGPSLSRECANILLLDTHASQARYMATRYLGTNDPVVQAAERWVRSHLSEDFDIPMLARSVGASPRTLARRIDAAVGQSPIAFVQRLRVETAVALLETSGLSLSEIGTRVGYADASTLSRLIRRETKASPREFRRHHASPSRSATRDLDRTTWKERAS